MLFRGVTLLVCLLPSLIGFAQSEDCSTEPSLIGSFLPISTVLRPMANDLAMTGAGCDPFDTMDCGFQDGFDLVVCFTPSNDCAVAFRSGTGDLRVATHVFTGPCMEPTACLVSGNTDTIFGVPLEGGTQYCFVAERCGTATMGFFIGEALGSDCGIFRDPSDPFNLCSIALPAWNLAQFSPCTGLDVITVRDLLGYIEGTCPCDFPMRNPQLDGDSRPYGFEG